MREVADGHLAGGVADALEQAAQPGGALGECLAGLGSGGERDVDLAASHRDGQVHLAEVGGVQLEA